MTNEELYYLPASELLKHIQAEKERLIKEKVIKKSKSLPPITEEEKTYELPKGWEWVRLGEYFNIIMGSSPKGDTVGDNLEGIEFHQGKVYFTDKYLKQSPQKTIEPTKIAIPNDVLLSVRAPVGTVNITQREICIGRGLCAIRPFLSDMPHQFIYYVLNAIKEEFIKQATGTTFIAITADVIRNQLFPLPPLYIQDQIVQKLEQLSEAKKSLLSHAQSQLNDVKKMREALLQEAIRGKLVPQNETDEPASVLLEKIKVEKEELRLSKNARRERAFPQIEENEIPFEIPSHWKWIRLGEIGIYKKGPFGSALKKSLFVPKGEDTVKVFEQKNAIQKNITLGDYYISKDYFETNMTGFEVFPGDILVSCAGTIGETYIVPENAERGIINQALMKMNIVRSINVNYFLYYFDFILKTDAQESSKGSAIKNIPPFEVFKKLLISLPPLAEQERIVAKLDELMGNCDQLEQKAEEMKVYASKMFEASLKEAFMPDIESGRS